MNDKGYGELRRGNRFLLAHRYSMEIYLGRVLAAEECVLHECDTPCCVNPDHLFLGTRIENNKDRDGKGRQARGSGVKTAKLTGERVIQLRKDFATKRFSRRGLAKVYGLSNWMVGSIVSGKSWKHLL